MFSSDFTDTCACESFTPSGSVRSLPSADVVVLRDELRSLEGIESNRSAADSITNVVIWWRVCHFKCNLFTYEALRSTEELVETCPCVPDWIRVWKRFWGEEKTRVPGEKPLGWRELTTNSTLIWRRPGPHWWEANVLITWSTKNFKGLCQASCYLSKRVKLVFASFEFPK